MPWQSDLRDAIRDRYDIDFEIGRGGMAAVFRARDLRHDRDVAVKVILPDIATQTTADRFVREIEIAAKLSHPHILPLLDSGQAGEFLYYVMPLVDGESLRDRLTRDRFLPVPEAVRIVHEVTSALTFAHNCGVIHRDIKPENIMLSGGVAVITDFGIARAIGDGVRRQTLTQAGFAVGTPAYMSPEQASGQSIDVRSDVYSFACLLYEMLGGDVPFDGLTPQAIYARQIESPPPSIVTNRAGLPPQFDAVLRRALSPDPTHRYASAEDFSQAVQACVSAQDLPLHATAPIEAAETPTPPSPRGPSLTRPLTVAAATLAVAFGAHFWFNRDTVPSAATDLAVFPFRTTGDAAAGLGEGLADLTAAAIDGTAGIAVADPEALWRDLRTPNELTVPDLDRAASLARAAGARRFVLGAVTDLAGQVDVTARVYEQTGALTHTSRISVPRDSLGSAVDRIAIDIVQAIWNQGDDPVVPRTTELATSSIEALQAYLEARAHAGRGDYDDALAAIERSTTLDSTFALAYLEQFNIRSILLYQNGQPFTGLTQLIDRAMTYRDRLPPRERYRIEGHKDLDRTDGARAAAAFERILAIDPTDWEAQRALAFTYLVYGWQIGKSIDEIELKVDALLATDSLSVMDRATAARLAALNGDLDRLAVHRRMLDRAAEDNPFASASAVAFGLVAADSQSLDSVMSHALQQPIPTVTTVIREVRMARPAVALRYLEGLTHDSMPVRHQQTGSGSLAQLWMGVGQVRRTDSAVQTGTYDRIRPVLNRFFVAAHLAGVGDPQSAARARTELGAFAPADSLDDYLFTKPGVWAVGWAVAAYEATFGDSTEARVWQRALETLPAGDTPWDWRGSLSDDIEARLAVRRNDLDTAVTYARRAFDRWTIHSSNVFESEPEPAIRFHLATILRTLGQNDEATQLFSSFMPPYNWEAFYTARAAFELGELARDAQQWGAAAGRYGQALALWTLGGPEVRDWQRRAQDGLNAAVEAER